MTGTLGDGGEPHSLESYPRVPGERPVGSPGWAVDVTAPDRTGPRSRQRRCLSPHPMSSSGCKVRDEKEPLPRHPGPGRESKGTPTQKFTFLFRSVSEGHNKVSPSSVVGGPPPLREDPTRTPGREGE